MSAGVKVAETSRDPSAVTSVIRHTVRAGSESRYEAWFRAVTAIAQTFPAAKPDDRYSQPTCTQPGIPTKCPQAIRNVPLSGVFALRRQCTH